MLLACTRVDTRQDSCRVNKETGFAAQCSCSVFPPPLYSLLQLCCCTEVENIKIGGHYPPTVTLSRKLGNCTWSLAQKTQQKTQQKTKNSQQVDRFPQGRKRPKNAAENARCQPKGKTVADSAPKTTRGTPL